MAAGRFLFSVLVIWFAMSAGVPAATVLPEGDGIAAESESAANGIYDEVRAAWRIAGHHAPASGGATLGPIAVAQALFLALALQRASSADRALRRLLPSPGPGP